jgi:outer membrane protein assembly factor BamB
MKIDPRLRGRMPDVGRPVLFTDKDSHIWGWRLTLPGKRPLATPAVVDGRVFIGGGFGGYEFYAFGADSGQLAWQYQTEDDGPTAAAVWDGHVVFNTESCDPAVDGGKVYMVYPDSRGDHRHYHSCFDLYSGAQGWKTPIAGEVITAPVLSDGQVYFTTLDGTLWCVRQQDGGLVWREPKNATSSPVVWNGQCYFSQREERARTAAGKLEKYQNEHLAARGAVAGSPTRCYDATRCPADYLDHVKRRMRSPHYAASAAADAHVGFGAFKGDAKMEQAMQNLGRAHVHAVWAYQGSKPFFSEGRIYSAFGDSVCCADPNTEAVFWEKKLHEGKADEEVLDHALTPPAIVNGKLFLGTIYGEVYCLSATTGEVLWRVEIGEPVMFQPAVARGRVYAATGAGSLFALETGNVNDDGWLMWGASATHNGVPEQSATDAPATSPWCRWWKD